MDVYQRMLGEILSIFLKGFFFFRHLAQKETRPDTRQSSTDGWAGAVMQRPLGIQKCDGPTDGRTYRPTDRHGKV